ncbi:glycosyltransferase [Lactobacillus corticis]|uniref:glycosyltransferase n=1 Tax=Lactobacillus corticis TaxID=2201249 RepID=UPI001BB2E133|nr:glycosyltransferase [Lactobacillus corticis]
MLFDVLSQMGFWLGWLIIPELFELIPALVGFVRNYFWRNRKLNYDSYHHPWVTIIIPVYNSAETLGRCLSSIAHSTYPNRKIEIICANNQSSDDSLAIFYQVKQAYQPCICPG